MSSLLHAANIMSVRMFYFRKYSVDFDSDCSVGLNLNLNKIT
jgi:hypothetical protein